MHEKCIYCGSDKFTILRIVQLNGNNDIFEYYCSECCTPHDLYCKLEEDLFIRDVQSHTETNNETGKEDAIVLEEWDTINDGGVYYIKVYESDVELACQDFIHLSDAQKLYDDCITMYETTEDIIEAAKIVESDVILEIPKNT